MTGLIFVLLVGAAYANKTLMSKTAKNVKPQNQQKDENKQKTEENNLNTAPEETAKAADTKEETNVATTTAPASSQVVQSAQNTTSPVKTTPTPVSKSTSPIAPTPIPAPAPAPVATASTVYSTANAEDFVEGQLLQLVNGERARLGLPALAYNNLLATAADIRVDEESITSFAGVDHTRPNGSSFSTVFAQVGYTGYTQVGENLVWGYQSPSTFTQSFLISLTNKMFTSWKNSSGHYAQIINPNYNQTGFGVNLLNQAGRLYYFGIEEFGKR